jgi:hypothetical protein
LQAFAVLNCLLTVSNRPRYDVVCFYGSHRFQVPRNE